MSTGPDPLFELTLAVADWMSAKKLDRTCDEINAAIAQTLAHLDRDEADDIVLRVAKLVRKQFEARQEEFITKRIREGQCRRIRKPATLRKHGDVLVSTVQRALR
jgi:hypothetical protein